MDDELQWSLMISLVVLLVLMVLNSYFLERRINKLQTQIDELKKHWKVGF